MKLPNLEISSLEEIVLIAVRQRECYGLEMIEIINKASLGKRLIGYGSLYPTLKKLEKRGLLRSRWGDDRPEERGGARRRYYAITELGIDALREVEAFRLRLLQFEFGQSYT